MTHDKPKLDNTLDMSKEDYTYLLEAFKEHIPNTTVWAYGSRVQGTAKPQSDLDIVIFATPDQKPQVFDLREALQESNVPFRVDLFVWDTVPQEFKKGIEETKMVLVEGEALAGISGEYGEGVGHGE